MNYNPSLDGLRALAAALVLLFHAKTPGAQAGFLGVDLFFVLSGYLITRSLSALPSISKRSYLEFAQRRLARLYPAILLLLALVAPATILLTSESPLNIFTATLFTLTYTMDHGATLEITSKYLKHAWSLAVEMKFYLTFPALIYIVRKTTSINAAKILITLFVIATLWRYQQSYRADDFWSVYYRFDTHCSGLLLGAALAFAPTGHQRLISYIGGIGLALTLYACSWRDPASITLGITAAEIFSACLIHSPPRLLGGRSTAYLGRISYGFYLWHYPFIWGARDLELPHLATLGVATLGGLFFAILSYHTVEKPRRIRNSATSMLEKTSRKTGYSNPEKSRQN